ncbi:MAG: CPBP family intramembrane metalloprotease [Candidatus Bathyarchaeota archaeon]|nr:CPBP family intramembrane metalloprotease [Candidatus Bathyarchaeota archaeon]MDH5793045.1 CPBP family intramembrane metalloprotease [Candidatus Bathyarchaeota archaeon]
MKQENGRSVFLGPFVILIISYFIYFIRYPMWQYFTAIEPIFVMLILSYLTVLIVAIFLLKKDLKKSLSKVFKNGSHSMIIVGIFFALIYLGLWYLISFLLGSKFEFTSSTILRDYETYTFYSLPLAFTLYLGFSVFGAFAEEVAYRGYVQTRISSRFGYVVGIIVATLFFSLEHIHIFQTSWILKFFETQFLHVLLFGIFVGYLFFKSKNNIWSVFSFHALLNVFSVSVPIVVTPTFEFAYHIAETASFITIILLLHFLPSKK